MTNRRDEPDTHAIHVRIQGEVQGVWFRNWIVEQATKRNLRGWVRNRNDGSLEAVFVGDDPKVRDMVAACRRGPPKAEVTRVIQFPGEYAPDETELPHGFKILPTV